MASAEATARVCPNPVRSFMGQELGVLRPRELESSVNRSRALSLELSGTKVIKTTESGGGPRGGLLWLDLDAVERRYLLSAAVNCTVAVYDLEVPTTTDRVMAEHQPVAVNRGSSSRTGGGGSESDSDGHRFSVSGCCWYPVDTGMFVTSSFDHTVKLWDTNCMVPACVWDLSCKVYNVAMSNLATSHCLVAAGCEDNATRLCDPTSGATSHTLSGHKGSVWAVAWSTSNDWQLFTGGKDGRLLAWDIRRAGVMWVLDEQRTRPLVRSGKDEPGHLANPQPASSVRRRGPGSASQRRSGSSNKRIRTAATISSGGSSRGALRQREDLSFGLNLDGSTDVSAVAHSGVVTRLAATPDGHHLISGGTDSRVRLWDAKTGDHLLVHYPDTACNGASKPRRMGIGSGGSVLYHPSGSVIQVFDVESGEHRGDLKGHFDSVNCCVSNPVTGELYSGAADGNIAVWAPPPECLVADEMTAGSNSSDLIGIGQQQNGASNMLQNEDDWSD